MKKFIIKESKAETYSYEYEVEAETEEEALSLHNDGLSTEISKEWLADDVFEQDIEEEK